MICAYCGKEAKGTKEHIISSEILELFPECFATIEDIYGFQLSHEQISNITDCVMEEVDRWRTRPLKPFYPFSFVDCIYVSMRTERGGHQSGLE